MALAEVEVEATAVAHHRIRSHYQKFQKSRQASSHWPASFTFGRPMPISLSSTPATQPDRKKYLRV